MSGTTINTVLRNKKEENMTLQEILKSFGLEDDKIKDVNAAVDSLLESKATDSKATIEDLNGKIASLTDELTPFKDGAKKDKIAGMLPEGHDPEKADDLISLANISDEDDDEAIKSKLNDALTSRDYLKKPATKDPQAKGKPVANKENENKDEETEDEFPNL